jgi:hypothetical protein
MKTENNIQIEELEKALGVLTSQQLRERYAVCYGHTPTTKNRSHLIKKILWAHQRDTFGDISEAARKKAFAIADDRDVKERFVAAKRPSTSTKKNTVMTVKYTPEPSALMPGTVLHRNYRGQDIRVLVLENGFEWEGTVYKSLSATARAITGTRWNGKLFFGLIKKGGE